MRRKICRLFPVFLLLLVLCTLPAHSQQLDLSFGNAGVVFTDAGSPGGFFSKTFALRAFARPGGGIAVLGRNEQTFAKPGGVSNRFILAAYPENATGSPTVTAVPSGANPIEAVQQADGKIVSVGESSGDWFVQRINMNGSGDTTFNSTGRVTLDLGGSIDRATNVAVQADGKIVVSGSSTTISGLVTFVARFNANGTLDTSFGPYGTGIKDIADNGVLALKMLVRPDGKILLAGTYIDGPETATMFCLLDTNGSPDPGFGAGGIAYSFDLGGITLNDMKSQNDGKVITLSTHTYITAGAIGFQEQEALLTRINTDGSRDTGFGDGGKVVANTSPPATGVSGYDPSGEEVARGLLIDSSGNIAIAVSSSQVVPARNGAPPQGQYVGRLERKYVAYLLRYNQTGEQIGKSLSRQSRHDQIFASYMPIDILGLFEQTSGKLVVYGTMNPSFYFSTLPNSPPFWPNILLTRFSPIPAVNDANNFFDYNFDGQAEFATYHPASSGFSTWLLGRSQTRRNDTYEQISFDFGLPGDRPVPGDYDGDGVQDLAVFRGNEGDWFTRKVYLNSCAPMECIEQVHWGQAGDIPAPGDFDGDGKTDRAIFRPSSGDWYILYSSGGYTGLHFGQNGDLPVTGDYDDDGKSDVAVIRREGGQISWYILQSSDNVFVGIPFGLDSDKAVPADYNGDGKTEIAVFRPSDGYWYMLSNYSDFSYGRWGMNGDIPAPADYDGDQKADLAVFRPSDSTHYVLRSHDSTALAYNSGVAGDIPIASAYVR